MAANASTRDDLKQIIESALGLRRNVATRVARITRQRSQYESSFRLEELLVEREDGSVETLMLKDVSYAALSKDARIAKARREHNPLRELRVYEHVLSPISLGPKLCATVIDEADGRYWLLIEKVDGVELYQVGELSTWQQCARWLATLHVRFEGKGEHLCRTIPLLRYDRHRAEEDFSRLRDSSDGAIRELAEQLMPTYRLALDVVYAWPQTFLHGDFYASNVLVSRQDADVVVSPVDWELAGVGPNLLDLAALTSGRWSERQRLAIASSYHTTWSVLHDCRCSLSAFLVALDCARLMVALKWLAAPLEWQPPEDHVGDWYTEACDLAKGLGFTTGRV
jgi:aminoglycoside phosphotransferase (APT) family kinase protein